MEHIADLIGAGPELMVAAKALASLPIGSEIADDYDMVIYRNGAGSITVGDVLAAKKAISRLFPVSAPPLPAA